MGVSRVALVERDKGGIGRLKKKKTHLEIRREGHKHLLLPVPRNAGQDILLRHIGDAHLIVLLRIVSEHHTFNPVLRLPDPALLEVVQDGLRLCLRACGVADITHGDAEAAAQQAAEVGRGVRELVLLPVALVQGDEDAEVVLPRGHFDRGSREFGGELVETPGGEALGGAVDVEGGDGGMVRGLLGEERDADGLVDAVEAELGVGARGEEGGRGEARFGGPDGGARAGWCGGAEGGYGGSGLGDVPVTL